MTATVAAAAAGAGGIAPVAEPVPLCEVLGALSHALDLTEGQPAGHCMRCCWIGVHVGRELGLDDAAIRELYYAILLKDLGCSSNAARICGLYLTDDIAFKRDFKLVGDGLAEVLGFVMTHTGLDAGFAERLRAIANIVRNGGSIARELIETRCQRGAEIARRLRFSEDVAGGIAALDEHWDGGGRPLGIAGTDIPLQARIALVCQVADVFRTSAGRDAALREVRRRSGTWFDPMVADAFARAARRPGFWEALASPDLEAAVLSMEPARRAEAADDGYLDDIAAAFADIVDSKSPYTSGHSARVAVFADMIAAELGHDGAWRRRLRRAALLHDIGKLGVSSRILDKPGRLDEAEWAAMRSHAALGEAVLSRIGAFAELARVGGAHHERLDGKGYPRGIAGEAICPATRIVTTADVFDALTAERPYRAAMPVGEALDVMRRDVGAAFDPDCFSALERALGADGPKGAVRHQG